ncbi:EpsG family protein [Priestia megaterium]|uniref:EpsG family protein n=1 Tax=Priestia megaterium TaxID=1404 RepID=UPI00159BBE94|nr:EpsG family protein [Priestia megaterium]MCM3018699.1 EpsG family protein [Priestia megaterium]
MASGIELNTLESYSVYFLSIFLATFFAYLSDKFSYKNKNGNYKVNKVFYTLSFLSLFLPVGLRGFGVDYGTYLNMYENVNLLGDNYFSQYTGTPEPFFAVLNYAIAHTLNNFQFLLMFSAFLSLFFIYLNLSRYVKKVSMAMYIWSYSFTYYLLLYGLVRMSIAIGITAFAYKYLETRNFKKYLCWCIMGSLFHYSALIMIPIYLLVNPVSINSSNDNEKQLDLFKFVSLIIFIIPILFIIVQKFFPLLFGGFSWFSRYSTYFEIEGNWRVINNIVGMAPLFIIILSWNKYFNILIYRSNLYIKLFLVIIGIGITSVVFPIHRVAYYLYPAACYLYASVWKLPFEQSRRKYTIVLYNYLIFIFGLAWIYLSIFQSDLWKPYLIPYYLNLP